MEAAGLALAILPLLLNQLDNYVQGLETLGEFRNRKYRRRLESYLTKLGNEQTFFINTLGRSLEGVVEYEDNIESDKISQLKELWERPTLQSILQEKLGIQYRPFLRTMTELSDLLKKLSASLGWDELPDEVTWKDSISFKQEFTKLKHILSKTVYNDLFDRINMANQHLEKLVEHSNRLSVARRRTMKKRPLQQLKRSRRFAHSLHSAVVMGKYWNCSCRDRHVIHFVLRPPCFDSNEATGPSDKPRFCVKFVLPNSVGSSQASTKWYEVEMESEYVDPHTMAQVPESILRSAQKSPSNLKRPKVSFSIPTPQDENNRATGDFQDFPLPLSSISDICLTLSNIPTDHKQREPLGCIMEGANKHTMYYAGNILECSNWQGKSLETLLESSSNLLEVQRSGGYLFSHEDRLRLAVNLASNVLQFHGNWLRSPWQATDIMFLEPLHTSVTTPYVVWDIGDSATGASTANMCQEHLNTSLIRSKILFPLGIVLVELSLGHTLRSLRIPEDYDQNEANTDLKTAARLLNSYYVTSQSGPEYHAVVERCLFWNGSQSLTLENDEMQDEIYQQIVLPLVENLKSFEKVSLRQNSDF
ncbi:hypothetical protein N7490_009424 [Penicillium lividum]|nr:hypothetical protein N7490_009424 [Penicillium lividum]